MHGTPASHLRCATRRDQTTPIVRRVFLLAQICRRHWPLVLSVCVNVCARAKAHRRADNGHTLMSVGVAFSNGLLQFTIMPLNRTYSSSIVFCFVHNTPKKILKKNRKSAPSSKFHKECQSTKKKYLFKPVLWEDSNLRLWIPLESRIYESCAMFVSV